MTDQDVRKASVPFIDLRAQQQRIGAEIEAAIQRVLTHGKFIMGPEVGLLEDALAEFCGCRHAVTCASGTDALFMTLLAWDVGPGDAVLVPSFTFAATAEVVALLGAEVVFVDVEPDTFNLSPSSLHQALGVAAGAGLRARAVIPVDLFGQPAEYEAISRVLEGLDVLVLADAAQSFGGSIGDKRVGTFGDVTTTSFFPAKPLGCYGDGGAIFTDDDQTADVLRSVRVHGQGAHKYDTVRVGINGRLDTIQAAVLLEKLAIFDEELELRQQVAATYERLLTGVAGVPQVREGVISAWAQYTLITPNRDRLIEVLAGRGFPTAIYYPKPLHLQAAYRDKLRVEDLACSEDLARNVLSIPMHPYLDLATQEALADVIRSVSQE